jgi:hypothetical protein
MSEVPKSNFALENPRINAINEKLFQQAAKLIEGMAASTSGSVEKYFEYLSHSLIESEIGSQETCAQFISIKKMNHTDALDFLNNLFTQNPEAWLLLKGFIETLWITSESEFAPEGQKPKASLIETATTWAGEEAMRIVEFQHGLNPKNRGQA